MHVQWFQVESDEDAYDTDDGEDLNKLLDRFVASAPAANEAVQDAPADAVASGNTGEALNGDAANAAELAGAMHDGTQVDGSGELSEATLVTDNLQPPPAALVDTCDLAPSEDPSPTPKRTFVPEDTASPGHIPQFWCSRFASSQDKTFWAS